jgi:hypothetical protein
MLVKLGLEVTTEKNKCMLLFHYQNSEESIKQRQLIDPLKMWQFKYVRIVNKAKRF